MIGVVVVTHGIIGKELVRVALSIMKSAYPMVGIAVEHDESPDKTRVKIAQAIEELKTPKGTLLMTDMFGGTPTNICLSFLEEGRCEVLTGVNLPILLKLNGMDPTKSLAEVATFLQEYGQKHISRAYDVLKGGSSANA